MKTIIQTEAAPAPIGPYNQAILQNGTLYVSGQIPLNPISGEIVNSDIVAETKQVMENLKAVLSEADMTFENVIKTSIFVSDMHDFSKINAIYGQYFKADTAPARETIEVSNLPKFVNVEISLIAIK